MEDRADFVGGKRAGKARVGFNIHLVVYLLVNFLLVGVNFAASPGRLWFYWPLLGWGVGLLAHALAVFVMPRVLSTRGKRR